MSEFYTEPSYVEKYYEDKSNFSWDFTSYVATGVTLSTATVSAYLKTDGSDTTNTIWEDTDCTVSGLVAKEFQQALNVDQVGKVHVMVCKGTMSDGEIVHLFTDLIVKGKPKT